MPETSNASFCDETGPYIHPLITADIRQLRTAASVLTYISESKVYDLCEFIRSKEAQKAKNDGLARGLSQLSMVGNI